MINNINNLKVSSHKFKILGIKKKTIISSENQKNSINYEEKKMYELYEKLESIKIKEIQNYNNYSENCTKKNDYNEDHYKENSIEKNNIRTSIYLHKNFKKIVFFIILGIIFSISTGAFIGKEYRFHKETVQVVEIDNTTEKEDFTNDSINVATNFQVEDVSYIEDYLNDQMNGKMPKGADGKKVVYLTFDDGPSETVTPKILDILKAENVKATFFVIGKSVAESEINKNITKRELAEENAIGNHTYSHNYDYLYPNGKINIQNCMDDFEKTNKILKSVLGEDFSTRAVRFPGGEMTWNKKDPEGIKAINESLHERDYHQIDWNSLSKDAEGTYKNAEQLKQEVIQTVGEREKAIILMHDTYGKEETAKALPGIIQYLKDKGYTFKTMK